MAGDPYYNSVKLLLPLDGENNSTTIVDKSKTPNAITASGDAIISTAQSKFGGSSLKLNGSSAFVETPYISQFDPATNDWTFEAFLYCLGYNSSSSSTICGTYSWASEGGTNNAGWQIGLSQTSGLITFGWGNNSWDSVLNTTTALPLNQWKHLALCKYGSVWTFYLDGISIGNATYATSITYPKTKLKIGSNYHSSFGNYYFYNGYVDDLRLTAGVSRYTSNFTPPAAPFDAFLPLVRVVTSVVSSAKLNILQSKTSALVVESTVLNALLVISQAKTSNLTAISSVSQASLLVASGYPQTSIITAGSTVSSATLKVIRSFASALLAESVTTTSSLVIERKLATVLSISSAVPSADLIINRALSSLLTAGSIVSLADLIATRMFISALVANSSVSSINLAVYRPFASLLIATSSISMPILAIGNQRPLSSVLAAESSTLPKPHLVIKRELISNNIALSATFGNLRNLRALVSELIAYSIVANADLSVTKLLGIISILTATSSVGGLRRLTVQRPLSTSLSVSSSLVGALQIDRALQSLLTGVSVITAIRPSTVTIAGLLSVKFGEVGTYNSPYLDQDMIKLLNQPTLEVGNVT